MTKIIIVMNNDILKIEHNDRENTYYYYFDIIFIKNCLILYSKELIQWLI